MSQLTQQEALNILVQAAVKAQSVGALSLDEAALVRDSISAFKVEEETTEKVD